MADTSGSPHRLRSTYETDPDMAELVTLFVSELPQRISLIESAARENRVTDLMRIAHQLKGAAAGYGFPTVGTAAGVLEAAIRSEPGLEDLASIQSEVNALVELCRRALK